MSERGDLSIMGKYLLTLQKKKRRGDREVHYAKEKKKKKKKRIEVGSDYARCPPFMAREGGGGRGGETWLEKKAQSRSTKGFHNRRIRFLKPILGFGVLLPIAGGEGL